LFLLYYLLSIIGEQLGVQGFISPQTAGWMPNGFMVVFAFLLMARVR
jgi:lipopolysaccharide export LptBFGC system permease protein LptF